MNRLKTCATLAAISLLALSVPQSVFANLVSLPNPSNNPITIGTGSGDITGLALDTLTSSFTSANFSGTLQSQVFDNTLGTGDLTFVYTISSDATSSDAIVRFTAANFLATDSLLVGNLTGSTTLADTADRTGANNGMVVGFNFSSTGLKAGETATLVIETTDTIYETGTAGINDGVGTTSALLAVPEPTTMVAGAMLLLPFGASTLRMLRRKSAV